MGFEKMEYRNPVWFCIPKTVEFLVNARRGSSGDVNAGLNYSIIMNSAGYLEGSLESGLHAVLDAHLPPNPIDARLQEAFRSKISRTHGHRQYDEMAGAIFGTSLSNLEHTKVLWPGFVAFFSLRHAVAHARAISSQLVLPKTQDEKWKDEPSASFKPIRDYLASRTLLSKVEDPFDTGWFYLADSIADYMWRFVNVFVVRIGDSLIGEDQMEFRTATSCPYHTSIGPPRTEDCESDPCVLGTKT